MLFCKSGCLLHGTGLFLLQVLQISSLSVGCRIIEICFWTWSPSSHLRQEWHLCSGQLGLCLDLKTCKSGNYMASLGCPVLCPQGKRGLSSCLAWRPQAGVHGHCPCHVSCSYQEMFGSITVTLLQIILGSY